MSNGHGGARTPNNPAPVSGPGRLARRTDGGVGQQTTTPMTGMGYGENADFNDIQSAAPLAAAPTAPNARSRTSRPAGQNGAAATPLFAPTQRPDEPVTAGAPVGPGPGPQPVTQPRVKLADTLAALAPFDDSGEIARLLAVARRRGW
jgi:hypothetical protein